MPAAAPKLTASEQQMAQEADRLRALGYTVALRIEPLGAGNALVYLVAGTATRKVIARHHSAPALEEKKAAIELSWRKGT